MHIGFTCGEEAEFQCATHGFHLKCFGFEGWRK